MSSILQIWDIGEPQCPICDGPLAYYTNDGEDEPSQHNWGATEKLDPYAANVPGNTSPRMILRVACWISCLRE